MISFLQKFKIPSCKSPRPAPPSTSHSKKEAVSNPATTGGKKSFQIPAVPDPGRKVASTGASFQSTEEDVTDIPELTEKNRLLNELMECDKRIHTFESCLLNIRDGKVCIH